MILRKPYAFFIKIFKPIHFILAILVAYLIYLENRILDFLNSYIYSSVSVVGQNIRERLVSNLIYVIPIIIILFSLIILGIMFRKKKPITFYLMSIFVFIAIIIINMYTDGFLGVLENNIVSVRSVKLIHDLILINIIIESVVFVFFVVRGMGLNFKKFDFDSEISKIDISESDKEEFELDIDVDLSETKRKRRRNLRYLKYAYVENKFLINSVGIITICVILLVIYGTINIYHKQNKEGVIYNASTFNFGVDETIILNTDYQGNPITNNYLVIVNTRMNSNYSSDSIFLNDFNLKVGDAIFKPTTRYENSLIDLGYLYKGGTLSREYANYLFVYEIPEKYITSEMLFSYINQDKSIDIKLNPKELVSNSVNESKKITEVIDFSDIIGDIKFTINDYDIKDKYILKYNYCIKKDDCIQSSEYLKASIDKNYDKYVLKLDLDYTDNSDLNLNSFYKFLTRFGKIYYQIDDTWYIQNGGFEDIRSTKVTDKNNIYIGINSDIINATSIKFVFDIRGSRYEYLLK